MQGFRRSLAALPLIALISGLAGSFFDSLLGATVQAMYYCPACDMETERRIHSCGTMTKTLRGISWINNDTVNFLATLLVESWQWECSSFGKKIWVAMYSDPMTV